MRIKRVTLKAIEAESLLMQSLDFLCTRFWNFGGTLSTYVCSNLPCARKVSHGNS
jgi:hypothetical protein